MIYVVVALAAEARPLIAHYRLDRVEAAVLPTFRRSDLALVESGVGKASAAAAVAALVEEVPADGPAVWLNLGVAGHRDLEIGTAVLAKSVIDEATDTVYELTPPSQLHLPQGQVRTVERVEVDFDTPALYEMEASAFCEQAEAQTMPELIQVLKIVSDNRRSGTVCVSARQVQGLIEESLPRVDLLVSSLHRLARRLGQ